MHTRAHTHTHTLTSLVAQTVKNLSTMQETQVLFPGQEDPLKKGLTTYTPVFLPGEFHGLRSLAGYSPWSCKESDMTEQLTLSLFIVYLYYLHFRHLTKTENKY